MPKQNRGPSDSSKLKIHLNYFQGGITVDPKLGIANSFYVSQNLDFRSKPSQISVLPGARTISSTMQDTLTDIDQDLNGVRYGVGDNGGVYRINTSNAISKIAQLSSNGAAGILYNQISDQVYIPSQTTVSMYGQVTTGIAGNPNFRLDQFAQSASNAPGCTNLYNPNDGFFDGIARSSALPEVGFPNTYSLPTTLSENGGQFCFFAPDIEPFYSIQVYIESKGTGNWTLTLHDSLNNDLASVTVPNANLISNGFNEFKFAGQVRAFVNASQTGFSPTYHFHLTSTVNDGTVAVVNTGDLSSVYFLLFAYRLVQTNNGWHPTALFTGSGKPLLCIGNGPYLSTYDFSNDSNPTNQQWQRHTLTFKTGDEVCGISANNQYLVIAVERRSKTANRKFQEGALYFWDGSTVAPNFVVDVPMGAPYGLFTFNNITYFACAGSLFAWSGGQTVIKVRQLAYQNTDYLGVTDTTIVNPNMFTSRYNLLLLGYPSTTTNPKLTYGVWSWGTVELTFPNSLCLSYTLANGQTNYVASPNNNLTIGCCVNYVDTLYMSWSYTDSAGLTHYGLDIVDNSSTPATQWDFQSLIYDGGVVYKTKNAHRYKLKFLPLPGGTTLQAKYSIDRGSYVLSPTASTGDTDIVMEIDSGRFHELQWGFQGTATSAATSPPTITGVTMELDPLVQEVDVRRDG